MVISAALMMAVAAPAGAPAHAAVELASGEPALLPMRLKRPRITWQFALPSRSLDPRDLEPKLPRNTVSDQGLLRTSFDGPPVALAGADEPRLDTLVIGDPGAQITGRRIRRSAMAAGLSLKLVQADGVLSSLVGMSGPVGKALTRIASEAVDLR